MVRMESLVSLRATSRATVCRSGITSANTSAKHQPSTTSCTPHLTKTRYVLTSRFSCVARWPVGQGFNHEWFLKPYVRQNSRSQDIVSVAGSAPLLEHLKPPNLGILHQGGLGPWTSIWPWGRCRRDSHGGGKRDGRWSHDSACSAHRKWLLWRHISPPARCLLLHVAGGKGIVCLFVSLWCLLLGLCLLVLLRSVLCDLVHRTAFPHPFWGSLWTFQTWRTNRLWEILLFLIWLLPRKMTSIRKECKLYLGNMLFFFARRFLGWNRSLVSCHKSGDLCGTDLSTRHVSTSHDRCRLTQRSSVPMAAPSTNAPPLRS